MPLEPQPLEEEIMVMRRFYTCLKRDPRYKKKSDVDREDYKGNENYLHRKRCSGVPWTVSNNCQYARKQQKGQLQRVCTDIGICKKRNKE